MKNFIETIKKLTDQQLTIVRFAMEEFARSGIRSVKMDDIASGLGISKRTLYEAFPDKEALLLACVQYRDRLMWKHMQGILSQSDDTLDIILGFYTFHQQELKFTSVRFFEDIKRYPSVMKYMADVLQTKQRTTASFYDKGFAQGVFRADVNMTIVACLLDALSELVRKESWEQQFPIDEIFRTITLTFIRGIATTEGYERLEKALNDYEFKIKQIV